MRRSGSHPAPDSPGKWELYDAWNAGIKREVFSGQWAGQPVYLDLEPEVLSRLSRAVGDGGSTPSECLTAAVRPTLHPRADGVGLFSQHLARERRWRAHGGNETPPFLAVLALLSVVAEAMRGGRRLSRQQLLRPPRRGARCRSG